jgi:anti-sigma B factor antagonist
MDIDMLVINHEVREDILLLSPEGRIDSNTADDLSDIISKLATLRAQRIVIDLIQTDYLSSAGLRVILLAAKDAQATGGRLTLCRSEGVVKDVISVTGFDEMLGMHASVDAAIAALAV